MRNGYQLALRSDSLFGPYERRVVLAQGASPVNGPHQGGWVDDGRGGDWFIHFQDVGPYGRVTHLQPVDWSDGWPVMGDAGTPVSGGDTGLPAFPVDIPLSDDFSAGLGPLWQWQANPDPGRFALLRPGLRLYAEPVTRLYDAAAFLSRLMPCRDFDMDVRLTVSADGAARAGIGLMGRRYACAALCGDAIRLFHGDAEGAEREVLSRPCAGADVMLRLRVRDGLAAFCFAADGRDPTVLGEPFPMAAGGWTGARPGVFCMGCGGYADVHSVRFTPYR